MRYKLVCDSCCDLTPELRASLNAVNVPLTMSVDSREYRDDNGLDLDGFLASMKASRELPHSACPSPADFADACEGAENAFIITLSSRLSGSYSSALIGAKLAEEKGIRVHVFDSKSASAGEIAVAVKVRQLCDDGLSFEEIVETTEKYIKEMQTFFVLENLDNLAKNGRMSKLSTQIAAVLHIRPILGSDGDGNIAFYSKAKGTKMAIEKLCSIISEHGSDLISRTLVITHCKNPGGAERLRGLVRAAYRFRDILVVPTRGLSSMYANTGGIIMAY